MESLPFKAGNSDALDSTLEFCETIDNTIKFVDRVAKVLERTEYPDPFYQPSFPPADGKAKASMMHHIGSATTALPFSENSWRDFYLYNAARNIMPDVVEKLPERILESAIHAREKHQRSLDMRRLE